MPPRSKKTPDMAAIAKLMERYGGIKASEDDLDSYDSVETVNERITYKIRADMAEIEGILRQVHYRHSMVWKKCEECKREFQTVYCYDRFCSPSCRDTEFRKHFGLTVAGLKALKQRTPKSFWEYEEYEVISPDMVDSLKVFCEEFLQGYEDIKKQSETQYQSREPTDQESQSSDLTLPELEDFDLTLERAETKQDNHGSPAVGLGDVPQSDPFDLGSIGDVLDFQ